MRAVHITKQGFKHYVWNGDLHEYEEKPIPSFLNQLRSAVTIEPGVTLGDILRAVAQDQPLKIVIGEYSWCNMDVFHEEATKVPLRKSELKYLEVSCHFEFNEGVVFDFHGRAKEKHPIGEAVATVDYTYAIDFTPVNELVDLEVRLNEKCPIFNSEFNEVLVSDVCFSLLDVLGEIYYEISFHGTPQKRNDKMADLLQAVKEVESGEAKLTPFEEIQKKDTIH